MNETDATHRRNERLVLALTLWPAAAYALLGLGFLGAAAIGYTRAFSPVPAPVLLGVPSTPVEGTAPVDGSRPDRGTYGVPAGWSAKATGVEGDGAMVLVRDFPAAPGVPTTTAADRRSAAELLVRVDHSRLAAPREVTVAGRPAVEIAGANGRDDWVLHTYAFGDGHVTEVRCHCFGSKRYGFLLWRRSRQDWERAGHGCAAVLASLKVVR